MLYTYGDYLYKTDTEHTHASRNDKWIGVPPRAWLMRLQVVLARSRAEKRQSTRTILLLRSVISYNFNAFFIIQWVFYKLISLRNHNKSNLTLFHTYSAASSNARPLISIRITLQRQSTTVKRSESQFPPLPNMPCVSWLPRCLTLQTCLAWHDFLGVWHCKHAFSIQ